MTRIYKLIDRGRWEQALAQGRFEGAGADLTDGYIHFSTADQAAETARRYFAGQPDLLLLTLETDGWPSRTAAALRWEPARGGALFPHLYGRLLPESIIAHCPIAWGPEGQVRLP